MTTNPLSSAASHDTNLNDGFQLQLDPRTGFPTAISGDTVSEEQRSACASLNQRRASGFIEASKSPPSGEPTSVDVWSASFARRAEEWELPTVDLQKLGLDQDHDGFVSSGFLQPLTPGAEAQPFLDKEFRTVYKLFDLRPNGSLGKKLLFNFNDETGFEVDVADATWIDTIEKILILNAGGGLPTELLGLADSYDYLIAKQPLAYPFKDLNQDRERAEHVMRGIYPVGGGLRQHVFVSQIDADYWVIGDLHERNIMRDSNGEPTIIDALAGKVTPLARKKLGWLNQACIDAAHFRRTGERPESYFDNVNDDEL